MVSENGTLPRPHTPSPADVALARELRDLAGHFSGCRCKRDVDVLLARMGMRAGRSRPDAIASALLHAAHRVERRVQGIA